MISLLRSETIGGKLCTLVIGPIAGDLANSAPRAAFLGAASQALRYFAGRWDGWNHSGGAALMR